MDTVVHTAALLHIVNPPPELREKYERVNIGGTATVVEAAIKAGVKRVVLFSTIAVYGPSDGRVLHEMSPTHPDTFYAQTKRAAEQIVLNAKGADGQPLGTVLRLGAVYGSRIKGNYERLTRALAGNLGTQYQFHGNLGTRSQFLAKLGHVPKLPIIPPVTRAIIDKYTEDIAVDGSLIQKELGFVPQYDLKAGWEETIREMQA